jgi:hypothetical protein
MQVEKYSKSHEHAMIYLMSTRQLALDAALPKLGYVVYDERGDVLIPVCAGFLREVEGGAYLFDSLVSNKNLSAEQRGEGMSLLWSAILGSTTMPILGFTKDEQTYNRALEAGFVHLPHAVLSLSR